MAGGWPSGPRSSTLSSPKAGQPGAGAAFRRVIVRWVQHRVEHLEPAFDRLIAANRHDQEIARAGRRDIGHPDRLGLIALQLLVGSFEKLDRRRAAERLQPEVTIWVDVPARGVAGRAAGRVGEDHHRELQALGLVYGHHPHTLGALLDDRSLVGLAALGIRLELLDEGAEGGSASLEMPRHVDQPLAVGERLLAGRPERDAGMCAHGLQQHGDGLSDRAVVAPDVKPPQELQRVGDLDARQD